MEIAEVFKVEGRHKMTDVIDFEEEVASKRVEDYVQTVADTLIETYFSNGVQDYEGAVEALRGLSIAQNDKQLRRTTMSFIIERIESEGHWAIAMKLRELMKDEIDQMYENINKALRERRMNKEAEKKEKKKKDLIIYSDVAKFIKSLKDEEKERIKEVVRDVFRDDYDFSNMLPNETYDVMKDLAKYAFYHDEENMKELCFCEDMLEVAITFKNGRILDMESKDAIAFMTNIFHLYMVKYNKKDDTITETFGLVFDDDEDD